MGNVAQSLQIGVAGLIARSASAYTNKLALLASIDSSNDVLRLRELQDGPI